MLLSSTRFLGSRKFPVSQLGSFSPRLLPKCISAFQPSLRTANNFHTGNRLPQSASKIQKAIYLLHAITLSTVVYIISTNIKVVPETGHKQLDCTWENWNKRVGIAKLNLVCKALAKLKKAGVNLYIGPDDERLKRIGRIAQRIFIGNNLNQDSWFIAMLDNTSEFPQSLQVFRHENESELTDYVSDLVPFSIVNRNAVFLNSKILCTSDDELAFHLSYEIANCIIKPEREVIIMMLLAMGTVPSILLNRTLRKSIALSALGIFCGFFLNSCHRQAIEIDRLASKIMASAGYNSAAALQVAMKERNAVSIIGWTFLTTSWPYLEERVR